jgi:hypothetical protein
VFEAVSDSHLQKQSSTLKITSLTELERGLILAYHNEKLII